MKKTTLLLVFIILLGIMFSCVSTSELMQHGNHYQKYKDYNSLKKAVDLMPVAIDTKQVKKILGEPLENSFDYRFLTDSISPNGCAVGAVFNLDLNGKITQRWVGEICE